MKTWTEEELISQGYKIENAKITGFSMNMKEHACFDFVLFLRVPGGCVCLGGYKIGTGYLGCKCFEGSPSGIEYIMRIMNTVGVEEINDLKGKYIRIASEGWGSRVTIFGNIMEDEWFDYESFFSDKRLEKAQTETK